MRRWRSRSAGSIEIPSMPGRLSSVAPDESVTPGDLNFPTENKVASSASLDTVEPRVLPQLPEILQKPSVMMAAQIAGAAALSYASSSSGFGGSTGVFLAAAHATGAAMDHVNTATQVQRQIGQAKALHYNGAAQALRLHNDELVREAEQHMQDITSQLREAQKEADRDLWEQLNMEKESIMTVASLFLAGGFALTVEGLLPAETGGLWLLPRIQVVDAYYLCLGLCVGMLFVSVLAGMATVRRMSRFMLARTAQQQLTLRKLRQIAHDELRGLRNHIDAHNSDGQPNGVNYSHASRSQVGSSSSNSSSSSSSNNSNNSNSSSSSSNSSRNSSDGGGSGGGGPREAFQHHHMQALLREKRKLFSERLWEQPLLVSEWRSLGQGRHVSDFSEWFHFDAAATLSVVNVWFFKGGALFLLAALGIYTEAHLRSGDEEEEATSDRACLIYWITLGGVAALSFALIELCHIVFPTPSWQGATFAEDSEHKARTRRSRARLETVNVSSMRETGDKFFEAIDLNSDGSISLDEICRVLGVPTLGVTTTAPSREDREDDTIQAARGTVYGLLRSSPILLEAVPRLLRLLLQRDPRVNPQLQQQKLKEVKALLDRVSKEFDAEPAQQHIPRDVNREKYRALMETILLEMGF